MLAAAEAGRDVAYFTFGDSQLMTDVHKVHSFLIQKNISVGKANNQPACFFFMCFCDSWNKNKTLFFFVRILLLKIWSHETIIWLIISGNSTFWMLWYQSTEEARQHQQSPCLHLRRGVWSPGAVLQLSVQEQPQPATWCQPLLLHLPAGQLLPGARWLRRGLGQTTHPHRQLLRSGGWWVTVPFSQKMKQSAFSFTFYFNFVC